MTSFLRRNKGYVRHQKYKSQHFSIYKPLP